MVMKSSFLFYKLLFLAVSKHNLIVFKNPGYVLWANLLQNDVETLNSNDFLAEDFPSPLPGRNREITLP